VAFADALEVAELHNESIGVRVCISVGPRVLLTDVVFEDAIDRLAHADDVLVLDDLIDKVLVIDTRDVYVGVGDAEEERVGILERDLLALAVAVRDVLSDREPDALPVPLFVDMLLLLIVLVTIGDFDTAGE
jgi:hypothetical protein